ncbi:hypothetical protein [Streptacidiphilus cavernicola]|uniref:Uncharacterized protein n=1 Tax=Streptacidiphilus cavernicola TaxID=3342716 RepID=A0ABV6VQ60_9ACTN
MPSTPFALVLSEDEIAALADEAVADLARRVARRAFRPLGGSHPAGAPPAPRTAGGSSPSSGTRSGGSSPSSGSSASSPSSASSAEDPLATLHALAHLQRALARQIDRTAARAAHAGAGYPELGQACNMTRQGARRRWPGLVPGTAAAVPTRTPTAEPQG